MEMKSRIIYEDNNIIVCHKPAGIATQTAKIGQPDMVSEMTRYLASGSYGADRAAHNDLGGEKQLIHGSRPYVGLVHRLDQPVEGILVFAKDKQSAAVLSRQAADGKMEKYYCAVVRGGDYPAKGELVDYLIKDNKTNLSKIVPKEEKGARWAKLDYEIVQEKTQTLLDGTACRLAFVRIHLHTGRHHQIRVQMSGAGMSILGDCKYADGRTIQLAEQMKVREIALCACELSFRHPKTGKIVNFKTEPQGEAFRIFFE